MSGRIEALNDGRLVFHGDAPFDALHLAQEWCRQNEVSFGSTQRGRPTGLLRGDFEISKWGNMTASQREALDGTMSGDMRNGPVVVAMKRPNADSAGGAA